MDAHFDPNKFHPTFLGDDLSATTPAWDPMSRVTMDSFLAQAQEHCLAPEIVSCAMAGAFDFFGHVHCPVLEGSYTAAHSGNPTTYADDFITIGRSELLDLGIHDKNSLSLIGTHEVAHLINQYLYAHGDMTTWQSELMADKWMGYRAAAEGLDLQSIFDGFENNVDDAWHPGGDLRNMHIQQAYNTYNERIEAGLSCDFDTLAQIGMAQITGDADVAAREQAARMAAQSMAPTAVHGLTYSESEINSKISEQESKIDYLESLIKQNEREMENKLSHGEPCEMNKATVGRARIDLENAQKKLNEFKGMKK